MLEMAWKGKWAALEAQEQRQKDLGKIGSEQPCNLFQT